MYIEQIGWGKKKREKTRKKKLMNDDTTINSPRHEHETRACWRSPPPFLCLHECGQPTGMSMCHGRPESPTATDVRTQTEHCNTRRRPFLTKFVNIERTSRFVRPKLIKRLLCFVWKITLLLGEVIIIIN